MELKPKCISNKKKHERSSPCKKTDFPAGPFIEKPRTVQSNGQSTSKQRLKNT